MKALWNTYNTDREGGKKRQRPGSREDLVCGKCDQEVDLNDLSCSGCKIIFCQKCTGLSKPVYACVRSGELSDFMWSCRSCKSTIPTLENISSSLKDIQTSNVIRFGQIEERLEKVELNTGKEALDKMKEDITSEVSNNIATAVDDRLKEYEDQRKRELNIILFRLPEKHDESGNTRKEKDYEDLVQIARALGLKEDLDITTQFRLGKQKVNTTRPLKVILRNKSQRKFLLENARFIPQKLEKRLASVVIVRDLTEKQQQERKIKHAKKQKSNDMELVEEDIHEKIDQTEIISPIKRLDHLNTNDTNFLLSQSTILDEVGEQTVIGGIHVHGAETAEPTSPTVPRD